MLPKSPFAISRFVMKQRTCEILIVVLGIVLALTMKLMLHTIVMKAERSVLYEFSADGIVSAFQRNGRSFELVIVEGSDHVVSVTSRAFALDGEILQPGTSFFKVPRTKHCTIDGKQCTLY